MAASCSARLPFKGYAHCRLGSLPAAHSEGAMALSLLPRPSRIGSPPSVQGPHTSLQGVRGRMATSKASTPASGMSCLTARFSTRSPKPGSSWKAGAAFTIHCALMDHWATGPQPQRSSFRSPRGRLLYPNLLRRPRWRRGRPCTNIQPGPLVWSRSPGEANLRPT